MKKLTALFVLSAVLVLPNTVLAATLNLTPTSGTYNKGCIFSVTINLDTENDSTDGTDAILIYDPTRYTANKITSGTIYPDYPGNSIDATTGRVNVSGLASATQQVKAKGALATVDFQVKNDAPAGASAINLDFDAADKTKTVDSNVVKREGDSIVDVLNSVTNSSISVGSGTGCAGSISSPNPQTSTGGGIIVVRPTSQPQGGGVVGQDPLIPKTLPDSGFLDTTITLSIIGGILTVIGIIGLSMF